MSDSSLEIIEAAETKSGNGHDLNLSSSMSSESLGASLSSSLNHFLSSYLTDDDVDDEGGDKDIFQHELSTTLDDEEDDFVKICALDTPQTCPISELQIEPCTQNSITENDNTVTDVDDQQEQRDPKSDTNINGPDKFAAVAEETLNKSAEATLQPTQKHIVPVVYTVATDLESRSRLTNDETASSQQRSAGDNKTSFHRHETLQKEEKTLNESPLQGENHYLGYEDGGCQPEIIYVTDKAFYVGYPCSLGQTHSFPCITSRSENDEEIKVNTSTSITLVLPQIVAPTKEIENEVKHIFQDMHQDKNSAWIRNLRECRERRIRCHEDVNDDQRTHKDKQKKKQSVTDCSVKSKKPKSPSPLRTTRLSYGFFTWIQNIPFLHKFARNAKNTFNFILTALDPGMAAYMGAEAKLTITVVTNDICVTAAATRGFESVFKHMQNLDIRSMPCIFDGLPAEVVGFEAGLLFTKTQRFIARQRHLVPMDGVVITTSSILVEITPNRWHSCTCIALEDPAKKLDLHVYTQTSPVPNDFVDHAKLRTPEDYSNKNWGYKLTVGEVMACLTGIPKADWQKTMSDVSYYSALENAMKTLAGTYKRYLEDWTYP